MTLSSGIPVILFALLQTWRPSEALRYNIQKCTDEEIKLSCRDERERIHIRDAYTCTHCIGSCTKPRHESSDVNIVWERCNLQNSCDAGTVSFQGLYIDYECVPIEKIPSYSLCFEGEIPKKEFYLYSPGYPKDLSNNRHCECFTKVDKPTPFKVVVHQGQFPHKELYIMVDNFLRLPYGFANLPVPKGLFKVVYENNKKNTNHRVWMKVSFTGDVNLTCRDVNAMPSGGGSSTAADDDEKGGGLIIALIGVGCIVLVTLVILIPAAIIYRRKRQHVEKEKGGAKADHIRNGGGDKMMLDLYGPQKEPHRNGDIGQTELGRMKENDLYESGEGSVRLSHVYQVAGYQAEGRPTEGNLYEDTDIHRDEYPDMKENDLYQPTDMAGGWYPPAGGGGVQGPYPHTGDDLSHMKVNDLYQPTDLRGEGFMKENDLYYPAEVTGYNRRPRTLPKPPRTLPKPARASSHGAKDTPATLPKPKRASTNVDAPATSPKPKRVSEEIYQDVGE